MIINGETVPVKLHPELQSIIPPLPQDIFEELKDSISHRGIIKPVDVASISDETETGLWVIDGYNRTNIAIGLGKPIPATEIAPMTLQEALEYSEEINLARRHLTTAQRVIWGLKVHSKLKPEEIAKKVKVGKQIVYYAKDLLEKIPLMEDAVKKTEIENGLKNGELSIQSVLKELNQAEVIDATIADIESPTFKEEMEVKYATSKYNKGTDKKLEEDIAKHDHPERYTDKEAYYEFVQTEMKHAHKGEEKWEDNVCIMTVVEANDWNEAGDWIKKQALENRAFAVVCYFYLPEKVVKQ